MSRVVYTCTFVFGLVGCANSPANDQVPGRDAAKRQDHAANLGAKLPRFLREDEFSCAIYAEAVNHFVDMGEEKAIAAMKVLANLKEPGIADREEVRLAFTCRVLFEPTAKSPLREPLFGQLGHLPPVRMPPEQWPLFPIVHVGSSYFVLGEGYSLAGLAEPSIDYINYCCANGRFRRERVPLPTKAQALRDFYRLRKSEPWKALKWKDKGQGLEYQLSESFVLEYLKAQADRISNS
jgi:hypothetical protein